MSWDIEHLHTHLQGVVDLELWTVPFYMSALYSIKDPASEPYRLVADVVHEEMLHIQLASNVANAFGLRPTFTPPRYTGQTVPHIAFDLDTPNPVDTYAPFSAEIGPLDELRVNTMCLIEYPEWRTHRQPDVHEDRENYGSIAEFYDAVRAGLRELRAHARGGVNQVDEFRYFYNELPDQTITYDGDEGYLQALALIDVITDQGEGQSEGDTSVAPEHQNTADGFHEAWTHFHKFTLIRDGARLPATFTGVAEPEPGSPGAEAQATLVEDFAGFMATLDALFGGERPADFGAVMAKLGGDILTCWQRGAIPRVS
jgi:Ferritin-like